MAIHVRTPRGGWSEVQAPTNYGSVVSGYASILQQAKEEDENNEINEKVLQYNAGSLSYSALVLFLKAKIAELTAGSSKQIKVRELLLELEETEREKKVTNKRAELESKYAKDGITEEEQLEIEEELLKMYKAGTTEYQQQIAIIAKQREKAAEESKERKIAELTASLSEGGLTKAEEVKIYEEMVDQYDPGSLEYSRALAELESTRQEAGEEQRVAELNTRRSELIEQYMDEGLTNEEQLEIIQELRTMVEPGSEEDQELIEEEAGIRQAIAEEEEAAGKAGKAESLKVLERETDKIVRMESNRLDQLEEDFAAGRIDLEEYIAERNKSFETMNNAISTFQGGGGDVSGETLGDLEFANNLNELYRENYDKGRLLSIHDGKTWKLTTLDDLINDTAGDYTFDAEVETETGEPIQAKLFNARSALNEDGLASFVLNPKTQTFTPVDVTDNIGTEGSPKFVVSPMKLDTGKTPEYSFLPKTTAQIKSFNIAEVVEKDKGEMARRLREEPQFRAMQTQAGETYEKYQAGDLKPKEYVTPEQESSLRKGGFLSPVGTTSPKEQRLFAGSGKTTRGIMELIRGRFKTGKPKEPAERIPFTPSGFTKMKVQQADLLGEQLGRFTSGLKTTLSKYRDYKLPKYKAPKFSFSLPKASSKFKSTISGIKSTATSLWSKAKSWLGGLFKG